MADHAAPLNLALRRPMPGFSASWYHGLATEVPPGRQPKPMIPRRTRRLILAGGRGDEFGDLFGLFAAEDRGRHPPLRGCAVDALFDRVEDAFLDLVDRFLAFGRA